MKKEAGVRAGFLFCVPSMTIDLEVEVLSEADRSDRSEPQGVTVRKALKAAGNRTCGVTNRNRIGGGANQGEWANDHEALAIKERSRRSGTRAGTADESYLGRSRLMPERATPRRRRRSGARSQQRP